MKKYIPLLVSGLGLVASLAIAHEEVTAQAGYIEYQPAGTKETYDSIQAGGVPLNDAQTNPLYQESREGVNPLYNNDKTGSVRVLPSCNIGSQGSDGVRVQEADIHGIDVKLGEKAGVKNPQIPRSNITNNRVLPTVNKRELQAGDLDQDGLRTFEPIKFRIFDETGDPVGAAINTSHSNIKNLKQTPKTDFGDRAAGSIGEDGDDDGLGDPEARTVRVEVRGWDPEKKKELAGRLSENLGNNENWNFGGDDTISGVRIDPDKVSVSLKRPAKLFGFIPVAYEHAFTMDDKGKVSHGRPWWLIFARSGASDLESAVDYVFQNNETNLEFLKLQNQVQRQSEAFQALSNVLKTKHDTVKNSIGNVR